MAKTVVALEATINASGAESSVKSLKAQLKEAQAEVQNLSDKFGATSTAAVNAAKKAAELKDRIGDAKSLTDAFNPDAKFQAFGAAIKGVAGGFAALQGAQALFGSKSQELEKTLAKVQGAMALSQGIDSVLEAKDSFVRLGAVVKDNVIKGFNGLKAAIGGTGIGLLVIGLGLLIANFDKVKKVVENLFPGFAQIGKFIGNIVNSITDFIGVTSEAERATQKLVDANKKQIEATDQFLKFNADKYDEYTVRKIKANNEFRKSQNEIIEKYKDDPAEQQRLIKEAREFANREIERSESDRATKAKEIREKQAEERKKEKEQKAAEKERDDKEAAQKEKERLDNIAAQNKATDELILRNRRASIKNEFDQKQFDLATNQQKEIDAELDLLNKKLIDKDQYEINKANIDAYYKQQEKDLFEKHNLELAEKDKKDKEDKAEADKKAKEEQLERDKALVEAQQGLEDARIGAISGGIGILKSLGDKSKAIQATALIAENAVTIAKIILDTQKAIVASKAATSLTPAFIGGFPNPAYVLAKGVELKNVAAAKINAAVGIATAIAATAKGLSALGGGGAGGGGGVGGGGEGGATAPVQPQVATTTINQGQVNQLASATSRAFVLESDVSGNQERIERLNRAARIN
jgi:hypothetical protein